MTSVSPEPRSAWSECRWRLVPLLICAGALGSSAGRAEAVGRGGQGRIELSVGPLWTTNNAFAQQSRAAGIPVELPYAISPHLLASFGYWLDESFEISLEGGYDHLQHSVRGLSDLTIDSETVMASLRWCFVPGYNFWPYLGGSFGYAINSTNSPFAAPWNNWNATGYGEAAAAGLGWDLDDHVGVSAELRYTFNVLQSPVPSALNAGGLSLLIGVYLRVPREPDIGLGGPQ